MPKRPGRDRNNLPVSVVAVVVDAAGEVAVAKDRAAAVTNSAIPNTWAIRRFGSPFFCAPVPPGLFLAARKSAIPDRTPSREFRRRRVEACLSAYASFGAVRDT